MNFLGTPWDYGVNVLWLQSMQLTQEQIRQHIGNVHIIVIFTAHSGKSRKGNNSTCTKKKKKTNCSDFQRIRSAYSEFRKKNPFSPRLLLREFHFTCTHSTLGQFNASKLTELGAVCFCFIVVQPYPNDMYRVELVLKKDSVNAPPSFPANYLFDAHSLQNFIIIKGSGNSENFGDFFFLTHLPKLTTHWWPWRRIHRFADYLKFQGDYSLFVLSFFFQHGKGTHVLIRENAIEELVQRRCPSSWLKSVDAKRKDYKRRSGDTKSKGNLGGMLRPGAALTARENSPEGCVTQQ